MTEQPSALGLRTRVALAHHHKHLLTILGAFDELVHLKRWPVYSIGYTPGCTHVMAHGAGMAVDIRTEAAPHRQVLRQFADALERIARRQGTSVRVYRVGFVVHLELDSLAYTGWDVWDEGEEGTDVTQAIERGRHVAPHHTI